ncbi:MAG: hypothetical protein CK431_22820 [Mycobacterium sp.]|nr:MAG: hypothetical protein CK431_22820 [Mycobacterium sp.]
MFNRLDLWIRLFCQSCEVMLETQHAVAGRAVRLLLDRVSFTHGTGMLFAIAKSAAEIVNRAAALFGECAGSGIVQPFGKKGKSRCICSAVGSALRKKRDVLVVGPLIAYE